MARSCWFACLLFLGCVNCFYFSHRGVAQLEPDKTHASRHISISQRKFTTKIYHEVLSCGRQICSGDSAHVAYKWLQGIFETMILKIDAEVYLKNAICISKQHLNKITQCDFKMIPATSIVQPCRWMSRDHFWVSTSIFENTCVIMISALLQTRLPIKWFEYDCNLTKKCAFYNRKHTIVTSIIYALSMLVD